MNATVYKKYHESFMSNNHGSTAIHTFFAIYFAVLCTILCCFQTITSSRRRYVYEYIVLVLPIVYGQTLLAGYVYHLSFVFTLLVAAMFVKNLHKVKVLDILNEPNVFRYQRILSVSCLRGLTYLLTVLCILAVDFRIFPRYLAKTEKYGFSLMDTGVGLFILMSGLVHKEVKGSFSTVIKDNVKLVTILLVLGMSRFVAVKQLNYQEHITEYGVHWNFFYTLAVTKVLSSYILYNISNKYILLSSLITGSLHEYLLELCLKEWVFSDIPRDNLLNANREGISSCLGYVSLYLFAVYLKKILNNNEVLRKKLIIKLLSMLMVLCVLIYICNSYRPASRTLTNLTYCLYLETLIVSFTLLLYIFEISFQFIDDGKYYCLPVLISAVNNNGLLYFLFANLSTGLINLSVRTLFMNAHSSMVIMNVYMITSLYFVVFLQRRGIRF